MGDGSSLPSLSGFFLDLWRFVLILHQQRMSLNTLNRQVRLSQPAVLFYRKRKGRTHFFRRARMCVRPKITHVFFVDGESFHSVL